MSAPATSRRAGPRIRARFAVTLARARGNPVAGNTLDLGSGGMRVSVERPLHVDELLSFDLCLDGDRHVGGHARVLREQVSQTYALRFEDVEGDGAAELRRAVGS
jgi:hypothetical protein